MVVAVLLSFGLVFCAESEDKSQVLMDGGGPTGKGAIFGTMLGMLLSTAFAVAIGFILERQLSDHRLNFTVLMMCSFLGLICLSQALMHVRGIEMETNNPAAAVHTNVAAQLLDMFR